MTERFHVRWSPVIGLGSVMNAALLVAAIGAGWATIQLRMQTYEDQLERYEKILVHHGERIGSIESLQVTLAELVIQQQHVMNETARIESAVDRRLDRIDDELDRLRVRIREIELGRGQSD